MGDKKVVFFNVCGGIYFEGLMVVFEMLLNFMKIVFGFWGV